MSRGSDTANDPKPSVIAPDQRGWDDLPGGAGRVSVRIDLELTGAPRLVQRVLEIDKGATLDQHHDVSEDVLYVVSGRGELSYDDHAVPLRAGIGAFVEADAPYRIRADEALTMVSVLSPPPGLPDNAEAAADVDETAQPWVHESDEEIIAAGDDESRDLMDRYFKLMVDPRHGAHYVTQFIGFIERSKAPPHVHTYDEVVYILDGEGKVHISDGTYPIGPGNSIYLPPGTSHCLENPDDRPLALLGVFCPAGSPKARK